MGFASLNPSYELSPLVSSAIAIDMQGPFVQQLFDSTVDRLPIFQMTEIV